MMTNTGAARREGEDGGDDRDGRGGAVGQSSVSAAGLENLSAALWAAEQGALLRGLAHALSNRVGTVLAAAGLLEPGAPAPAPIVTMLRDEAERLDALLALVRQLAGDGSDDAIAEPLHLPDLVPPAVALHAHHPDWRDVPVEVVADPGAPPVRVSHAALLRALLVALSAVKAVASERVRVTWAAAGSDVVLTIDGPPADAVRLRLPALGAG